MYTLIAFLVGGLVGAIGQYLLNEQRIVDINETINEKEHIIRLLQDHMQGDNETK